MNRIKSAFIGTGAFGKPILEKLIQDDRFEIMVITGQDTPQGRGLFTVESEIKKVALLNKLIVRQPIDKLELNQILFQSKPDVLLVVAYGKILTRETLNIAHFGAVNIHASLLPKYRGASPIQEALIHGDTQTGITWIQMTPKMDAGPILTQEKLPIDKEDTYQSLAKKLAALAAVHTTSILSQY